MMRRVTNDLLFISSLDWVCGGQWNKMEQFLSNFSTAVQNSKLDLVVFLNGSLETERLNEWCKRQEETYRFLKEIHQHVSLKRKPPPKIWWIPPAFTRSAIRIAFRIFGMKMVSNLRSCCSNFFSPNATYFSY